MSAYELTILCYTDFEYHFGNLTISNIPEFLNSEVGQFEKQDFRKSVSTALDKFDKLAN